MIAATTLPASPSSPGVARRWAADLVRAELATEPGAVVETVRERVELVVSELATNAVVHARSDLALVITVNRFGGDRIAVRIEATDSDSRPPRLDVVDDQALGGRGLLLVARLTDGMGFDIGDLGKTVWAEFEVTPLADGESEADRLVIDLVSGADVDGLVVSAAPTPRLPT